MEVLICRNCRKEIFSEPVWFNTSVYCSFECLGEDLAKKEVNMEY